MSTFKIECLKLYKRRSVKVLFTLYGVIVLALSALYLISEKSMGLSLYSEGQFITASLSVLMSFVLPFITLYLSVASFGLEFSKGTIKNMFLLPVEKTELYISKVLSIQSIIGLALIIQFIYSLFFGMILDGGFSMMVLGAVLLEYLGAFVILGLINLVGALLSLFVSSTGLAVFLAYILYVVTRFVGLYYPALKQISLATIVNNYKFLFSNFNLSILLSVIAYYIILVIVGSWVFEKKEESVCQYE